MDTDSRAGAEGTERLIAGAARGMSILDVDAPEPRIARSGLVVVHRDRTKAWVLRALVIVAVIVFLVAGLTR